MTDMAFTLSQRAKSIVRDPFFWVGSKEMGGTALGIAAWGLVSLELAQAGIEADIYVADSRVRYLKPVFEDLVVDAGFDDPVERAALADTLRKQGRASIRLKSESLLAEGGVAASFVGRYVAILRSG